MTKFNKKTSYPNENLNKSKFAFRIQLQVFIDLFKKMFYDILMEYD